MTEKKVNRTRSKAVTVRMTSDEYVELQQRVSESGLTQQAYIIASIKGCPIASPETLAVQKEISRTFSDLVRQLRGVATNVNQMAHTTNSIGYLPDEDGLMAALAEINSFRKESEELWQLIRSSINQQNRTVR